MSFRPNVIIHSLAELDVDHLLDEMPYLDAVTFDLDRTIVGYHDPDIPFEQINVIKEISSHDLGLAIVSNALSPERYERVDNMAKYIGSITGQECVALPLWEVGGRPKPNAGIFIATAEKLGVKPNHVIHFGDQILKDVVGASRAGFKTGLVAPYGPRKDHRGVRYAQRPLEGVMRFFLSDMPTLSRNFPNGLQRIR